MHVAVIGTGAMGGAILSGLVDAGWDPGLLTAIDLSEERREHFASLGCATRKSPTQLGPVDIIVIATKPQHVDGAVEAIAESGFGGGLVVSVAAGVSTAAIERRLGATPVIRCMPNTPALVGKGMSALAPGAYAEDHHVALASQVLGAVGEVVTVAESDIDAITAVSGSGPAYVFFLAEAMEEAGVELGLDPSVARTIVAQTVLGAGVLLSQSSETAATLRENVTSPGGTTAAALAVMRSREFEDMMRRALRAAADRSRELGET